ncbi:MAG: hypothetical protein PVJ00_03820 [Desulfobacterales bacterium]|jgi:hypothetical protein
MTPIYFPHTYVARPVMKAVQACFSPVVLYQPCTGDIPPPLREWEKTGQVILRVPVPAEEEKLASLLTDFRNWAALHRDKRGIDLAYFRTRKDRWPFFDETSGAWILADIKGKSRSETRPYETRLLNARLLLRIAQDMDVQNDSLATDLQRAAEMEQTLFRHLRGDEAIPRQETGAQTVAPGEGADYMLKERIGAWALLAVADAVQRGPDASGIFVTASRSVAEYLAESGPAAVKVFEAAGVPVDSSRSEILESWRGGLLECLIDLVHAEQAVDAADKLTWPPVPTVDGPAGGATLRVYLFPGLSSGALLRGSLPPSDEPGTAGDLDTRLKNMVVAWIER